MFTSFDDIDLEKITRLLKSNRTGFLSGEQISKTLGISRAAVWKNIKKLQSLGYKIQSRKNAGYMLLAKTDLLLPWEVSDGLQTDIMGRKIYYFNTIDSTQNFALKLATRLHEDGSLVIAKKQTHGRGRENRKWVSPKGGIWISILLRPNFEISHVSLFPMITSLALAIAIEKTLKLKPKIKWPNDVTLGNKKVAGILVDASIQSNRINYLVIGVGINFRINPKTVTRIIKGLHNQYGVTTLVGKNEDSNPATLLQAFLFELEQLYTKMTTNSLAGIKDQLKKRSSTIGRNVTVSTPNGKVRGKAVRMDDDGALVISHHGRLQRLLVGDVSY